MHRGDLGGVARRGRTKRVDKQLDKSSVSLANEEKENDCFKSFSNNRKKSTNSLETVNGAIDAGILIHDLNHRRENGFKASDTSRVDRYNEYLKSDCESNCDETTRLTVDRLKHSYESGNVRSETDNLSLRRTISRDTSRPPVKEHDVSLEVETSVRYIPSWIRNDLDTSSMDLNSMRTLGILPKGLSLSMTDLRPEGRVSMKQPIDMLPNQHQHQQPQHQHEVHTTNGTKHEEVEKEYLKLKRKMNQKQKTDLGPADISQSKVSDKTVSTGVRFNMSDTMIPRYKELLASDDLGINHFRKHIHNVKVSSKRHKRALKLMENATNRAGTFHTNRRNLKFKPLYEQKHSEEAQTETGKYKSGGSRS